MDVFRNCTVWFLTTACNGVVIGMCTGHYNFMLYKDMIKREVCIILIAVNLVYFYLCIDTYLKMANILGWIFWQILSSIIKCINANVTFWNWTFIFFEYKLLRIFEHVLSV